MTAVPPDTFVACLTPPGTAALATLGLHGPESWAVCRALFTPRSGELPESAVDVKPGWFWLGRFGEEMKDEAVLALRRAESVPWVELHCHGGRELIDMLLDVFRARGMRVGSWEDWERRTEASALRAEAAIALARALTPRTASILLDQYQGAMERALADVRAVLERGDAREAEKLLESLTRYAALGRHLTTPWRVVVAGAPNVGKSSLVNALAGFRRSVVAETPGTTRDVVTTRVAIDGWPVELADTAGVREGAESLEEQGIDLARAATEMADLCLWLVDVSTAPAWPEALATPVLRVINKIDLPPVWDLESAEGVVHVSARTGEGLAELCEVLSRRLVPDPPPPGTPVPFTSDWCERLVAARQHCAVGRLVEARATLGA
ncbi:MAG: 50S ribosome-binding GTPase [Planctomycetes bacterium]|nr:50S ribosome-binding GTPase [Planctomycetota bacterium]